MSVFPQSTIDQAPSQGVNPPHILRYNEDLISMDFPVRFLMPPEAVGHNIVTMLFRRCVLP